MRGDQNRSRGLATVKDRGHPKGKLNSSRRGRGRGRGRGFRSLAPYQSFNYYHASLPPFIITIAIKQSQSTSERRAPASAGISTTKQRSYPFTFSHA